MVKVSSNRPSRPMYGSLYLFITVILFINNDLWLSLLCSRAQSFISGPNNSNMTSLFWQVTIAIGFVDLEAGRLKLNIVVNVLIGKIAR